MEKKHKQDLQSLIGQKDGKEKLLNDFDEQKINISKGHAQEIQTMKAQHTIERVTMKKEHEGQIAGHVSSIAELKKQIQDLELEHTEHKGKLQTSIINLKSDHSEALCKQREAFDLEAHKTALETKQRHQRCLEELKETHKLYTKN